MRSSLVLRCAILVGSAPLLSAQGVVDFSRDVAPILSNRCFTCHGPDAAARRAKLRLDRRASLFATRKSGRLIHPGKSGASLLVQRIRAHGEDRMPPVETGPGLTADEIATIARWIDEGAAWTPHWSFVAPKRAALPEVDGVTHPIDRFVRVRLARVGLEAAPQAEAHELVRRLSFDLRGHAPSRAEVQAFGSDRAPGAYERLVDRMLASKADGERMAFDWLNAGRYSDTDGYQQDAVRDNWPWRDWVIQAFERNMPYDRFSLEQIAGDLLPKASAEQRLSTCFQRNHMTNGEGGRDPAESRVEYVIDRVNTFGTVWLGMTVSCAQCHDHKYDPISQRDYYALSAYFDSIDEDGRAGGRAKPHLSYKSPHVKGGLEASRKWLDREKRALDAAQGRAMRGFDPWMKRIAAGLDEKFRSFRSPKMRSARTHVAGAPTRAQLRQAADGRILVSGPNERHQDYTMRMRPERARVTAMRLSIYPIATPKGPRLSLGADGQALPTGLKLSVAARSRRELRNVVLSRARADHEAAKRGERYGPVSALLDDDPRSGWWSRGRGAHESRHAVFAFEEPLQLDDDEELVVEIRHRSLAGYANVRAFRVSFTDELGPATTSLDLTPRERLARAGSPDELRAADRDALREEFLAAKPAIVALRTRVAEAQRQFARYERYAKQPVRVQVLQERKKPRVTTILKRGVWNQRGAVVQASVPERFGDLMPKPAKGARSTRLELAKWLFHEKHPLTARVFVNRLWQKFFGAGLVRTPGDFGRQGQRPEHAELLDWLSVEFRESGRDIKAMIKTIVTSATYRQSSKFRDGLRVRDPENRLLARQSRFRLPSWMIRDSALHVSALLDARRFGPPVFPPQPLGAWADATMGRLRYRSSVGPDRYRRSLYTFWRRLSAPTVLFDAPARRVCRVRELRTNTPLQALTLMNDEVFGSAASALGRTALASGAIPPGDAIRIETIFGAVLQRRPDEGEREILQRELTRLRGLYSRAPAEAVRLAGHVLPHAKGDAVNSGMSVELASWTMLATTILNLDEAQVRP